MESHIERLPCLTWHLPRLHATVAGLPIVLHCHPLAVDFWQRQLKRQREALQEITSTAESGR